MASTMEKAKDRGDKCHRGYYHHPAVHVSSGYAQRLFNLFIPLIAELFIAFSRAFRPFGRGNQLFQVRQYSFHFILQFSHPLRQRQITISSNHFLVNRSYLFSVWTLHYTVYAPFGHLLISWP